MKKIMQQMFQVDPLDICLLTALVTVVAVEDILTILTGYLFFLNVFRSLGSLLRHLDSF
jgi:hypothetical protein